MKRDEADKLLGGYAAGNLTPEEREVLCRAALEDQTLFDELAREQALRELLADPGARAQLLRDLREDRAAPRQGLWSWVWKPAVLALAGSAAGVVLMVSVVRYAHREAGSPALVAQAPRNQPAPPQVEAFRSRPAEATPPPAVVEKRAQAVDRAEAAPKKEKESTPPAEPSGTLSRETEARLEAPPQTVAAALQERAKLMTAPAARSADAVGRTDAPAGLSCVVLRKDAEGNWRESSPDAGFRAGEQVRLRVLAADSGFVAVTVRDGAETSSLTPDGGAAVKAGEALLLPAEGVLEMGGSSGAKSVRISFSATAGPASGGGVNLARSRMLDKGAAAEVRDTAAKPARAIELRLVYGPQ